MGGNEKEAEKGAETVGGMWTVLFACLFVLAGTTGCSPSDVSLDLRFEGSERWEGMGRKRRKGQRR